MSRIAIDEEELRLLLCELRHLREQVTDLQASGTKLLLRNREIARELRAALPSLAEAAADYDPDCWGGDAQGEAVMLADREAVLDRLRALVEPQEPAPGPRPGPPGSDPQPGSGNAR